MYMYELPRASQMALVVNNPPANAGNTIIFLVIKRNLSHLKNHFTVENLGQHSLNQGIKINRAN